MCAPRWPFRSSLSSRGGVAGCSNQTAYEQESQQEATAVDIQQALIDQEYIKKVKAYFSEKADDSKSYELNKSKDVDKQFLKASAAAIKEWTTALLDKSLYCPSNISDEAKVEGTFYITATLVHYIGTYENADFNDERLANIASELYKILGDYPVEDGSTVHLDSNTLDNDMCQLAILFHELVESYDLSVKKTNGQALSTLMCKASYKVSSSGHLYEPADKAALKKAITRGKKKSASKYTDASYKKLSIALDKGQKVLEKETAEQPEVNTVSAKIKKAISNLKKRPPSYSGYGDSVVKVSANYCMATVKASYSGGSNFVIWSLNSDKEQVDLLVNTIGSYSGTTLMGVDDDVAYLKITASGSWHIELGSPWQAPQVKKGKKYSGDAVMMFDKDNVDIFKFKANGTGNIVLRGYNAAITSSDLLVNDIGNSSGEYINSGYCLFEVISDGTWSVSW